MDVLDLAESVTLELIGDGSFSSAVSGTTSAGEVSFSSCDINGSGEFIIKATASGIAEGYSEKFIVTSGAPSSITFSAISGTVYRGEET